MGKKYIIELEDNESVYKTIIASGYPMIQVITPAPYAEPDLEQVREEAYADGYKEGCDAKFRRLTGSEYQRGLNDAWECARKIANMPYGEEERVFGSGGWTFIVKHTASEAIEKIRQYEQRQEEDGLRHNIQTIVDQCGYSLDEIAAVLQKMKES